MKDWEKELTKEYLGKTIDNIPKEITFSEIYGHTFSHYGKSYAAQVDEAGKIKSVNLVKLKRKYK